MKGTVDKLLNFMKLSDDEEYDEEYEEYEDDELAKAYREYYAEQQAEKQRNEDLQVQEARSYL